MPRVRKIDNREADGPRMVRTQLVARGIMDERVLDAMMQVDRAEFVSPSFRSEAYGDHPLPIECGQTISQPYTVAFMAEAARITEHDKVLEIGTGSGYGAAVLSLLRREVHTVERIPLLAVLSSERLDRLGYANVHVHQSDGTLGLSEEAPFSAIIVTAGARLLPQPYVEQLGVGGRIIIPIGDTPRNQMMFRFILNDDDTLVECQLGRFAFVPLVGAYGWRA